MYWKEQVKREHLFKRNNIKIKTTNGTLVYFKNKNRLKKIKIKVEKSPSHE